MHPVAQLAHVAREGVGEQGAARVVGEGRPACRRPRRVRRGTTRRAAGCRRAARRAAARASSITLRRKNRSSRNVRSSIARGRSTLVALITRTSTLRSLFSPIRRIVPSCSTRSSFIWPDSERLPISSRNSVPPLAASKRPTRASGRARERARLGAEQLGLEEVVGEGAGVHPHERLVLATRRGLHDLGELLLAGAVGAGDQDGHVGAGDLHGEGDHAVHRLARVDEAPQVVGLLELGACLARGGPQRAVLAGEPGELVEVLHRREQLVVVPRLLEVVGRALLHERDGGLERAPGGEQHDGQPWRGLAERAEQRDPLGAGGLVRGEVHVLDHDRDPAGPHALERLLRGRHGLAGEVVDVEQHLEGGADGGLIVDDEDLGHGAAPRLAIPSRCATSSSTPPRLSRATNHSVTVLPDVRLSGHPAGLRGVRRSARRTRTVPSVA